MPDVTEPPRSRVVLIAEDDVTPLGTGFLVDGSHVLTARRALGGNAEVTVATATRQRYHAQVEWSSRSSEAVLLHVVDGTFHVPALPLSKVPSAQEAASQSAEALGYTFGTSPARTPGPGSPVSALGDVTRVTGEVRISGDESTGAFEFPVTSVQPQTTSASLVTGMMGAPVWVGQELFGVLTSAARSGRLSGVSLDHLLADDDFARTVRPGVFEMSPSVRDVIALASSMAGRRPVDASVVLLAALQYGRDVRQPGVSSELLTLLTQRHPRANDPQDLLDRMRQSLGGIAYGGPQPDDEMVVALTRVPPLSRLLAVAADCAERIAGYREVHLRHLILGTVLASDPPLRPELLADLDVSPSGLRQVMREAARAETTGEPIAAWEALLNAVPSAAFQLDGGIDADLVDPTRGIPLAADHLGAGVWVSMLAAVIADAGTPMPLSVGIFGEWGTGKSYFMGLLRAEIDRLSASERDPYLGHVAQIGFNAWHYADANLWASLGDEIFRQLAGPAEQADESRRRLRRELAEKSAERQALDARTALARDEAVKLQAELDAATAQRKVGASDLLTAARTSPALRDELDKVWRRLGVSDEAQRARILADEVRGTAAEGSALRSLLGQHRGWVLAGTCVVALVAIGAAAWVPASWGRWLGAGGATTVAVILAAGITVVARAREGLTRLRKVAAELSSGSAAAAEQRTAAAVGSAVAELRRAEAREKVAQAQLDEVVTRVGELAQQLSDLMPGQRLYSFLAERASSGLYAGQLGLISTIRKDFEHLLELLSDWRTEGGEPARRPIDRIVLYIDDLDRCRPQQVVEVLQAVHLLLALDLFVVVVGVDPRWLLRSLREQFRENIDDGRMADHTPWDVSPYNYLEKIFNIPFVLPGIPPGGLSRMLRGLAAARDTTGTNRPGVVPAGSEPSRGDQSEAAGGPVAAPDPAIPVEEGSELAVSQASGDSQAEPAREPPRPLTEPELALLSELESFITTPRDAKRLFNLYRMLRSTRDLSPASTFLGDDDTPGEYQAVAVLLGMLTADARLFGQAMDATPQEHPPVAGGLSYRPATDSWRGFAADLAPRQQADNTWANQVIGLIPVDEVAGWHRFAGAVIRASALVTLPDLSAFKRWAPRIRRFSFVLSPLSEAAADRDE